MLVEPPSSQGGPPETAVGTPATRSTATVSHLPSRYNPGQPGDGNLGLFISATHPAVPGGRRQAVDQGQRQAVALAKRTREQPVFTVPEKLQQPARPVFAGAWRVVPADPRYARSRSGQDGQALPRLQAIAAPDMQRDAPVSFVDARRCQTRSPSKRPAGSTSLVSIRPMWMSRAGRCLARRPSSLWHAAGDEACLPPSRPRGHHFSRVLPPPASLVVGGGPRAL